MKYLFLFLFVFSLNILARDQVVTGRLYFKNFLGHVHKNPSRDSSSLTIVQCSHSVKVFTSKHSQKGWSLVQVGDDKGYVQKEFLTSKRPRCFQERYPEFYRGIELDITEMYFWGRLYDHYREGKTRIK